MYRYRTPHTRIRTILAPVLFLRFNTRDRDALVAERVAALMSAATHRQFRNPRVDTAPFRTLPTVISPKDHPDLITEAALRSSQLRHQRDPRRKRRMFRRRLPYLLLSLPHHISSLSLFLSTGAGRSCGNACAPRVEAKTQTQPQQQHTPSHSSCTLLPQQALRRRIRAPLRNFYTNTNGGDRDLDHEDRHTDKGNRQCVSRS
jgi:hypothetical protein